MTRLRSAVAVAVLAVAAAVLPGSTLAPAAAAACSDAGGITVVVDPGTPSGSPSQTCVGGGGNDAATLFGQAGHELERVQSFPGAVCRVDGAPAEANCGRMPPTNRYWGLFWSNGTSGQLGVLQRRRRQPGRPDGRGSRLRLAGQHQQAQPGRRAARPRRFRGHGSRRLGRLGRLPAGRVARGGSGGSTGAGSDDGTPSASPSDSPSASASASPRERARDRDRDRDASASDRPRDEESETAEPSDDATVLPGAEGQDVAARTSDPVTDGGLPLWLVGLAALGLFGVGTVVAVVRRRAPGAGGA